MILHILIDDKFSDYAISHFSEVPDKSEFVIINPTDELKFVRQTAKAKIVAPYSQEYYDVIKKLYNYSSILFHGIFNSWCEELIKNAPISIKIAWMVWGGEIYGRKDLIDSFLAPRTKIISHLRRILKHNNVYSYELPITLYRRIDYCLTNMNEEYSYVRQYLHSNRLKFLWYSYYSIKDTLGPLINGNITGNNIIIGNSCTIECNYFDILPKLWLFRRKIKGNIILPLSYGSKWLQNLLIPFSTRLFGKRCLALTEFVPREQYNAILSSCAVMIQPHYRAQAMGNIVTALWLGMKVYLSEKNITYDYFKRLGLIIFSIEQDLHRNNPNVFLPLTMNEVTHNRRLLEAETGNERIMRSVRNITNILQ